MTPEATAPSQPPVESAAQVFREILLDSKQSHGEPSAASRELVFGETEWLSRGSGVVVTVRDLSGRILSWNRAAQNLYGFTSEEALGQDGCLLFPEGSDTHREALEVAEVFGSWDGTLHPVSKSGDQLTVESRWVRLDASEDSAARALVVIEADLGAERRRKELALRAQRLETVGALVAGLAHSLNNMLEPGLLAIYLLRQRLTEDEQWLAAYLDLSIRGGMGLMREVSGLIHGCDGEWSEIDAKHLLTAVETVIGGAFPPSVELETQVRDDLFTVRGDAAQLCQVLINLCVRVLETLPENSGSLRIEAMDVKVDQRQRLLYPMAEEGHYVVFSVSGQSQKGGDASGAEAQPFRAQLEGGPFQRLAAIRTIVEDHGGFFEISAQAESSTEIKVYLPAVKDEKSPPGPTEALDAEMCGNGQLILLVDDDSSVREVAREVLRANGYRVVTAEDGVQAVAFFDQQHGRVDAVLTDLAMRNKGGAATIRQLRDIDSGVKIVAMTGLEGKLEDFDVDPTAIRGYLHKPFSAIALLETLAEIFTS